MTANYLFTGGRLLDPEAGLLRGGWNVLVNCMEFEILARVLTPAEIIRSATVIGARLCRLEGEAGAIVAGASADLVVVDGDPLEDISLLRGDGAHIPVIMAHGTFAKNTPG